MLFNLWGLFLLNLALSGLHDILKSTLIIGLPAAALPSALVHFASGERVRRHVVAAALMVFSALHIHQE